MPTWRGTLARVTRVRYTHAMSREPTGPARWFFDLWAHVYDAELVQRVVYRPEQDAVLATLRE